jgi:hypothetical protein
MTNAEQAGHDFTLSFSEFKKLFKRKTCAYSGLPLQDENNSIGDYRSIDRIDNQKGYVKGNVVAVCKFVNTLKGTFENKTSYLNIKDAQKTLTNMVKYLEGGQNV